MKLQLHIFNPTDPHEIVKILNTMKGKNSCEPNTRPNRVQELVHDTLTSFERKQYTPSVFLDLSKAIDTIDHYIPV